MRCECHWTSELRNQAKVSLPRNQFPSLPPALRILGNGRKASQQAEACAMVSTAHPLLLLIYILSCKGKIWHCISFTGSALPQTWRIRAHAPPPLCSPPQLCCLHNSHLRRNLSVLVASIWHSLICHMSQEAGKWGGRCDCRLGKLRQHSQGQVG